MFITGHHKKAGEMVFKIRRLRTIGQVKPNKMHICLSSQNELNTAANLTTYKTLCGFRARIYSYMETNDYEGNLCKTCARIAKGHNLQTYLGAQETPQELQTVYVAFYNNGDSFTNSYESLNDVLQELRDNYTDEDIDQMLDEGRIDILKGHFIKVNPVVEKTIEITGLEEA